MKRVFKFARDFFFVINKSNKFAKNVFPVLDVKAYDFKCLISNFCFTIACTSDI